MPFPGNSLLFYENYIIIPIITSATIAININRKVAIYWAFIIYLKMYSLFYILYLI